MRGFSWGMMVIIYTKRDEQQRADFAVVVVVVSASSSSQRVVRVFFIFFIFTSPPKTADRERSFLRAKMKRNPWVLVFQEKEKKQVKNHQSRARIFISHAVSLELKTSTNVITLA